MLQFSLDMFGRAELVNTIADAFLSLDMFGRAELVNSLMLLFSLDMF